MHTGRRIVGVVALVVVFAGAVYLVMRAATPKPAPVDEGWLQASVEGGGSFRYPPSLGLAYVTPQEWPPKATVTSGLFSCSPTTAEESPMAETQWRTIGRETYCVTVETGAAAGSVYKEYSFATTLGDDVITLVFTVQLPQCMNYDEPNRAACFAEQEQFDPDALVASIVRTFAR